MDDDQDNSDTDANLIEKQYPDCTKCGDPVDTDNPDVWQSTDGEEWWHQDCFDSETNYPTDQIDALINFARDRFMEKVEEHGAGKPWTRDDPEDHVYKAHHELSDAIYHAHRNRKNDALPHLADALNHIVFALDVLLNTEAGLGKQYTDPFDEYPSNELAYLKGLAEDQFREDIERNGGKQKWLRDEPRLLLTKAQWELKDARDGAKWGSEDEALPHFVDAFNHMLLALDSLTNQPE